MLMASEITPFNKRRFDECMAWFMRKYNRHLTQFQAVKLHVMSDAFHILEYGVPIIGGEPEAWPKGPVVAAAYTHVMSVGGGSETSDILLGGRDANMPNVVRLSARADSPFDPDDFSESEITAMERAWGTVIGHFKDEAGDDYFHSEGTFIGRAYRKARKTNQPIDWKDVVMAYDELYPTDHSNILVVI